MGRSTCVSKVWQNVRIVPIDAERVHILDDTRGTIVVVAKCGTGRGFVPSRRCLIRNSARFIIHYILEGNLTFEARSVRSPLSPPSHKLSVSASTGLR